MPWRYRDGAAHRGLPWLVRVEDDEVLGYACAGSSAARAAYDRTVEASIYLRGDVHGRGSSKTRYRALAARLQAADVHAATGDFVAERGQDRVA